jgi:regulatory protein
VSDNQIITLEQAKPKGWFELEVKGRPPFLVDEESIFRHSLRIGEYISDDIFEKLREEADLAWLKFKAKQILSRRMISERDLRRKLSEERRTKAIRDEAIAQLKNYGFIDDVQFTIVYIRSQIRQGAKSRLYLKKKLWEKGISSEIADEALNAELQEVDEIGAIKELAAQKYKTLRHLPPQKAKSRLISFLRGRGFSWDIIKATIDELLTHDEAEQY